MLILRPASFEDIPILEKWDEEPHVISATTDKPNQEIAFDPEHDWREELERQDEHFKYYIAENDGRPIGGMLIIDPRLESTHYWGEVEPDLRAIDIWIGDTKDLGKGYGEQMMRLAFQLCFAESSVKAILIDPLNSNKRAHRFYQRLGFKVVGRKYFGEDDCLVHWLTREDWASRFPQDHSMVRIVE
jgi:aminoglycoside 6'-N-acetyltransferase